MAENKVLTLVILRRDGEVLLGMKKRGFGQGKWNGFGGKVEVGETIAEAAAREVREECGVVVKPSEMDKFASITFEFKGDPVLLEVHAFQTKSFVGEPVETEEMRPQWFSETEIPFDSMWLDDRHWYPLMLANKKFKAYSLFEGHERMLEWRVEEVESL